MNRAEAVERVRKLQALADPARGGTPAEREVASNKAAALMERFGLDRAEAAPREPAPSGGVFTSSTSTTGAYGYVVWNPVTGEHSSNVRVHAHASYNSWTIEIEPNYGPARVSGNQRRRRLHE